MYVEGGSSWSEGPVSGKNIGDGGSGIPALAVC